MRRVFAAIAASVLLLSPALAQVSPLPANRFMASPSGSTGNLAPRALVSSDLFQGVSCPSGEAFFNNSGAIGCAAPSFTGGLISATTPLSFTVAGTSGGIPYFSGAATWGSTAALSANQIVLGGGAGGAPSTPIGLGTTTTLLHGNAAGAPSFGAIVSADVAAVLANAPAASFLTLGVNSAGMVGDGSTSNNTVFASLLASIASGGEIKLPCGVYKFTTSFSVTVGAGKRIKLSGASSECVTLFFSGTTAGITFTYGDGTSSVDISDLSFTTDDATGVNTALTLTASAMIPTGGPATNLTNLIFHGSDGFGATNYWGNGISTTSVSNVSLDRIGFYGGLANKGNGIVTAGTSGSVFEAVYNVIDSVFYQCNIGFTYGSFVQGVSLVNDNFTACKNGVRVPAGESTLDQLVISKSQFGLSSVTGNAGIYIQTNLPNTLIDHNLFIIPTNGMGITFDTQATTRYVIDHNEFGGADTTTTTAINLGITGGRGTIANNDFGTLLNSVNYVAGASAFVTGNHITNVSNYLDGSATIIGYGNTPEVDYAIGNLPTCNAAMNGVRLVINNGVASPTYRAAVSTTGTTWSPIWCSPTASAWQYD